MSAEETRVTDLMSKHVITVDMDDTLSHAKALFNREGFHHLVVTDAGKPVGVISDRDLLKHLSPFLGVLLSERPQDVATLQKKIHQVMTRRLISIGPDLTLAEAAEQMIANKVSCLPVMTEDQKLVGIITVRDIVRWMIHETSKPSRTVRGAPMGCDV
jgi:acetoin utilization protein AcuB